MAKTAVSATITLPYSQVEARTASRFRHHAQPKEAPITSLLTSAELPTAVHAALRAWSHTASTPTDLLAGLLLVQAERASTGGHSPTTRRLATNHVLHRAIELLQAQDPVGAQVLTRRFMDGENVLLVAHQLNLSEDQVKRRQRDALASLTRILWEQETAVRHERTHTQLAQLPPPSYTQLLGVDHAAETLQAQLLPPADPWLLAIVGIGGIGKTSLADAAARAAGAQLAFARLAWLRLDAADDAYPGWDTFAAQLAAQLCPDLAPTATAAQRDTALRQALQTPTLVIVDNLESPTAAADLAARLPAYANPSKFLLTSRVRLPPTAGVWTLFLEELPADAALALLRQQAAAIGLPELAEAEDARLRPILAAVGGNPLALKLVVGLAAVLPLPDILADLTAVHSAEIEQMYRHIFWRAWHSLDADARLLLELMPLAASIGAQPAQLQAMAGLPPAALLAAITQLVNRALLEVRGTAWDRRYGIHRLVDAFLRTEIIHWPHA